MTRPRVSVVVVSRGRPAALARCLAGLDQQFHTDFEIVVVGDPAALNTARDAAPAPVRKVAFDAPNISAARNRGIAAAAGDIVAFIDDDAVAEPTWLDHLAAPFADPGVAAAGGFVIGRNGISFQWRARHIDATGTAHALPDWGTGPRTFAPVPDGGAIKTEGTNMALRRSVLVDLGGFDAAFAFYLDETDLNLRLARAGHRVALVPLAQVHHGFAASPRRASDRAPLDLFDIGASSEVFWAKHLDPAHHTCARAALIGAQRARLDRHLIAGTLNSPAYRRLLASLLDGMADGRSRTPGQYASLSAAEAFRPVQTPRPGGARFVFGPRRRAATLEDQARSLRADGHVVSLLILSPTALYHRCAFDGDGIWRQRGGLWGRSVRAGPLIRRAGLDPRAAEERGRIAAVRGLLTNPEQ